MPVENFREQPVDPSLILIICIGVRAYVLLIVCCWSERDNNCSAFVFEKQ